MGDQDGNGVKTYTIQLVIDSQLEHVRLLGSALRGIGQELSLSSRQLGELELILVEAVNNVIEHAYEFQTGNKVSVCLECVPDNCMRLIISDQGKTMQCLNADGQIVDGSAFPDPLQLPEGGWGLALIHALADSCRYVYDQTGNHLHVHKQLSCPA